MKMKARGLLSMVLAALLSIGAVLPMAATESFAADPLGGSEGTVGYYHPRQGEVKYVFHASKGENIPGPNAGWLGGVEPDPDKQYVYCINPSRNAKDNKAWNMHFRWRYNLNANSWILDNNKNQLTNPGNGKGSEAYNDLKKILFVGYPYNKGAGLDGPYSYNDTQNAVEALIAGTTSKQNALYNEALAYQGEISGNVYFYAPDTDTKQIAQNTVGLALWNYPNEEPVDPIPDEPEPSSPTATVGVSAKKFVNGDEWKSPAQWANRQFAFKLEGEGDKEARLDGVSESDIADGIKFVHTRWLKEDAVTDADGNNPKYNEVFFGEIGFKEAGTYKFKVYELDPNITDPNRPNAAVDGRNRPLEGYTAVDGMTYDHRYYELEFVVEESGDSLVVKQNGEVVTGMTVSADKNGTDIEFTNEYTEPPVKGTLETTVNCDGKEGSENAPAEIVIGGKSVEKEVTDKIDYKNLQGGYTYKVQGTLVEVNDSTVKTVKTSEPVDLEADASGSGTWTISFGSVKLEVGKKYVVYEEATPVKDDEGNEISDGETIGHKNPEDKAQTIVVSKNPIEVTTKVKNQYISPAKDQSIVDDVTFKGLEEGKQYTLKGVIMNKKDGSVVPSSNYPCPVTADVDIAGMVFSDIDASGFADGDQLVVFEYLYEGDEEATKDFEPGDGNEVASHEDITDVAQTATVKDGKITLAKTTDVKNAAPGDDVPYTITVTNERAVPAVVTVIDTPAEGLVYSEASGEPIYDETDGTVVWNDLEVPANGKVELLVVFTISEDATGKIRNRAKVYEPDNPTNVLGIYEDDADVKVLGVYENSRRNRSAETGDDAYLGLAIAGLLAAGFALALMYRRRMSR